MSWLCSAASRSMGFARHLSGLMDAMRLYSINEAKASGHPEHNTELVTVPDVLRLHLHTNAAEGTSGSHSDSTFYTMTRSDQAQPTDLVGQIAAMTKYWSPEHVFTVNNSMSFKVAKILGEFLWHSHPNTDEVFVVMSGGPLVIELDRQPFTQTGEDGKGFDSVTIRVGETFCVPRGMRHRPVAKQETGIMMVEAVGTVNTGDEQDSAEGRSRTVNVDET